MSDYYKGQRRFALGGKGWTAGFVSATVPVCFSIMTDDRPRPRSVSFCALRRVAFSCIAMARALLLWAFLARAAAVADEVKSLPGVATLKNKHYAGYAVVNETTDRQLFYWFVEAESGNQPGVTPNIIWMNGGPGASSIMGLMVENIGPLTLQQSGELAENPHAWSGKNNALGSSEL
eukprot:s404_g5.t1